MYPILGLKVWEGSGFREFSVSLGFGISLGGLELKRIRLEHSRVMFRTNIPI